MLQYIIAFLGILSFVFFVYKKPNVETYVLFVAYALPFIDAKILPLEYGFVKMYDVISVVALILFFKEFISFKSTSKGKIYLILVILFWVFLILSKINSRHPLNNLYFLYQPFTIFIFARFLMVYLEQSKAALNNFISAFRTSLLLLVGVVFIQLVFGPHISYLSDLNPNVVSESTGLVRYPSLFQDSQTCGQFLALGSFSLLFTSSNITIKKKRSLLIAYAFTIVALFLAGSRSAILGFAFGLFVLFLFENLKTKMLIITLGVFAGILFLIATPTKGIFSRTETISEDYIFRKSIWTETKEIIKEYPILGIGFGNFQKYIKRHKQDLYLQTEDGGDLLYFNQPENGYLKILVEQGYLGFLIFVFLAVIPLMKVSRLLIKNKINKRHVMPVAGFLSWALAFNTVYSLTDYRILIGITIYLCLIIFETEKKILSDQT